RLVGTSALTVHGRRPSVRPLVLASIPSGVQLAALIELLSGDPRASIDRDAVRAALSWDPRPPGGDLRKAVASVAAALFAVSAVAIGLHGTATPVTHAPDDAITPNGMKRSQTEIIQFLEREVMPWARPTLGRITAGPHPAT